MRSIPILFLAGCGSQATFSSNFVKDYCSAYTRCDTSGRPCPVELEATERAYRACDFDRQAAKDCMAVEFTCNDEVDGFEVVVVPDACHEVCGPVDVVE